MIFLNYILILLLFYGILLFHVLKFIVINKFIVISILFNICFQMYHFVIVFT